MSAVPMLEDARKAIARLFADELGKGYTLAGCHRYTDAAGHELFRVVRLKHPDMPKVIRPMYRDGHRYRISRPERPASGWPLYVPPYPLVASGPVWIVEGEACADALAKLGMTATTSGGSSSAEATDWTPLAGRHVRLWPDHDEPGKQYGDGVASILRALGCTVERVDVDALGLPAKGDCVDWLAAHRDATAADVLALPLAPEREETARGDDTAAPELLRRPTPPAEPYPMDELGGVLAPAAQAMRRVIQAPDAIIGGSLLAAASLAVQGQADVHIDGRVLPLSLWLLSVAESGERKSAVDKVAMQPARVFEAELVQAHAAEREAYEAELAEWEARRDAIRKECTGKGRNGTGLAGALRQLGPAPSAPLLPLVTADDITGEGLFKLLVAGRPTLGAFTDEAAKVFGGHAMRSEAVMGTVGFLCGLWDSGAASRVRAGDGASKLYGRRLALHMLAQPVIAERALSDDVLAGQGFLARCLLAWPQGTAGTRLYVEGNLGRDMAVQRYAEVLLARFRQSLPLRDGSRQELAPRALRLSPEAFGVWRQLHDMVERQESAGGQFAQVKGWASKTAEQAARIAGVLTLIEAPEAQVISQGTMERAAELAVWHLMEAVRLAGTAELPEDVRDAEALQEWAWATGRRHLYSTDAMNRGPARVRDRDRFGRAMALLESAGWASRVEGGMQMEGAHRRHVWTIAPPPTDGNAWVA